MDSISEKESKSMIGVSPAYFISRFGSRFSQAQVAASLPDIKGMGYDGVELEVFHPELLTDWERGGAELVRDAVRDGGLTVTQFMAHFLLNGFSSPKTLASDFGSAEMRTILQSLDAYFDVSVVMVPLAAFDATGLTPDDWPVLQSRLVEKMGTLLSMVEASGRRMGLEIMPSAIVGGVDGFLRLCDQLGTETLGLNYDTGHANAAKENLGLVVPRLGRRIIGTHLCDNHGHENLSLAPGKGSVDFPSVLGGLQGAGYDGPLDVEIICPAQDVEQEYRAGLEHVRSIVGI